MLSATVEKPANSDSTQSHHTQLNRQVKSVNPHCGRIGKRTAKRGRVQRERVYTQFHSPTVVKAFSAVCLCLLPFKQTSGWIGGGGGGW